MGDVVKTMILTFSQHLRTETDPQVIATLIRKGWTEARMDVQLVAADDPRVSDGYPAGYPETVKPLTADAVAEHTEMTQAEVDALKAQHAAALEAYNTRPRPWRVSKDTLISRVLAAGKLPQVMAALASQTAEQQFVFEHSAWFWSSNATLRALCAAPGLDMDPDEILARDPFLF